MSKYSTIILSCFTLAFFSCHINNNSSKINVSATSVSQLRINPSDIVGSWYLNKWAPFHTLVFNEKTVWVDNNIDTVFSLNYEILHDSITTSLGLSGEKIKNKIITLTKDTLVLDGIYDMKDTLRYSRKNKEFK